MELTKKKYVAPKMHIVFLKETTRLLTTSGDIDKMPWED